MFTHFETFEKFAFNGKTLTAILLRSPGTEVARVHKTETQSNIYFVCRKHHTLDNNKMVTISAVACSVTVMLNNARKRLLNNYYI